MRAVTRMVRDVGRSTATVFITGESGTGKELCAQAIHAVSRRSDGPFIPLNCGAIPRDLLESEVFGHLKGSFTGAISDKKGAAAAADGGTLFLDEICEMDLSLQTKLLRFLQTSMIQPVGATRPQRVDVRILCATNRDPAAEVQAGRFRQDLFYRLHVVPIHLPPLRDRGADVIEIARRFLTEYARSEGKRFKRFDAFAEQALMAHAWPGNVRELQNVVRNIVVLNNGDIVTAHMLPPGIGRVAASDFTSGAIAAAADPPPAQRTPPALSDHITDAVRALVGSRLADVEREFIEETIHSCGGSIPKAARVLDVSPSTLYRKRQAWSGAED
jgi:two-component system repressor protein LuxO